MNSTKISLVAAIASILVVSFFAFGCFNYGKQKNESSKSIMAEKFANCIAIGNVPRIVTYSKTDKFTCRSQDQWDNLDSLK